MKIFHGPQNIGGMAGLLAEAQRQLGHDAWAYCRAVPAFAFGTDRLLAGTTRAGRALEMARLWWERSGFDCFHFYFGESLTGRYLLDVPWLKRLGKRVFFYFCGCDIRDSKHVIATYEHSACKNCWPMRCSPNRADARRVALEHADGIFVSTPDLLEFVPGATVLPQPIDLDVVASILADPSLGPPPGRPGVDRAVRVSHAPTSRQKKGTGIIEAAITGLQRRGLAVELVMIEGQRHAEALAMSSTCDLAIDQILIGAYGQYAAETMALGKPTLCYIRDDLTRLYPADCPLVSVSPGTLEEVLGEWVTNPARWPAAGAAGQVYAGRVHDKLAVARRCLEAYESRGTR